VKLTDRPVSDFIDALRSPSPTPGGGSAAALAGALGAALLAMVGSMPKHRAASEEDVDRLQGATARCGELCERLEGLVNRDSEAYDAVMAAYRLPKASDDEKGARKVAIQQAIAGAIETPLEVMRSSVDTIEAAAVIATFGNPNAASDVGVAIELLNASVRGARMNVEINLGSVSDAAVAERFRHDADLLEQECATESEAARRRLIGAAD
jgi:formiminotetrahydrofolate cyclodeaminase